MQWTRLTVLVLMSLNMVALSRAPKGSKEDSECNKLKGNDAEARRIISTGKNALTLTDRAARNKAFRSLDSLVTCIGSTHKFSSEALYVRAQHFRQQNAHDQSFYDLDRSLESGGPFSSQAAFQSGVWHSNDGNLPAAFRSFERALHLNPANAMGWSNLGVMHQQVTKEARNYLEFSDIAQAFTLPFLHGP